MNKVGVFLIALSVLIIGFEASESFFYTILGCMVEKLGKIFLSTYFKGIGVVFTISFSFTGSIFYALIVEGVNFSLTFSLSFVCSIFWALILGGFLDSCDGFLVY